MAGSVESLADIPIPAPAVVVGWLTEDGRVRHVETRVLDEVGTRNILDVLPEHISADDTGPRRLHCQGLGPMTMSRSDTHSGLPA